MSMILISFLSVFLTFFSPNENKHAFHISIAEIEIENDTLQISLRIFTDDLELALKGMAKEKVFLSDHSSASRHFILIKDYLNQRFGFGNGAKETRIEWLGHEFENDVCWIYGQVSIPKDQRLLYLRNEVLTDVHDNQQNLIHYSTENGVETKLATKNSPEIRFSRP